MPHQPIETQWDGALVHWCDGAPQDALLNGLSFNIISSGHLAPLHFKTFCLFPWKRRGALVPCCAGSLVRW